MSIRDMRNAILAGAIGVLIVTISVIFSVEYQERRDLIRECIVEQWDLSSGRRITATRGPFWRWRQNDLDSDCCGGSHRHVHLRISGSRGGVVL